MLIKSGNALFSILLPQNASVRERFAAGELARFLRMSTDADVPISTEYKNNIRYISLQNTQLFNANINKLPSIKGEGYYLKSLDGHIFIYGKDDYAAMDGVYGLLKELIGLEIFADDCFVYDRLDNIPYPAQMMLFSVPDIPIRTLGIYPIHSEKLIVSEVEEKPLYHGENRRYMYRLGLRGMTEGWGIANHSYFKILPPDQYREKHRDWYSQGDDGINLCLTNTQMRQEFANNLFKIVLSMPDSLYFMIGQEDNPSFCRCDNCNAAVKKYQGFESALMMEFSSEIALRVTEMLKVHSPGRSVEFCTFAYQLTSVPPVEKTVDRQGNTIYKPLFPNIMNAPNLGVMLAPLATHVSVPYMDKRNHISFSKTYATDKKIATADFFLGWRDVVEKVYLWTYYTDFVDYLVPFLMWETLQQNLLDISKRVRPMYMFGQGTYSSYAPNFTELKIYVLSKLMYDSEQPVDSLVDNFIHNYYGPGSEYIKCYFDRMNAHKSYIDKCGKSFTFVKFDDFDYLTNGKFWTKELLDESLALLDSALKLTDKDSEYYFRVFKETLPVKYLILQTKTEEYSSEFRKKLIEDIRFIAETCNMKGRQAECAPKTLEQLFEVWQSRL